MSIKSWHNRISSQLTMACEKHGPCEMSPPKLSPAARVLLPTFHAGRVFHTP